MNTEWSQAYLAEMGREIDNASTQLHETTNWSIGVVVAAMSAVAVAPAYPSPWTLAAVGMALVFTVRFFVRSCIAYSYLSRWNRIHRAIVRLEILSDGSKRAEYEWELKHAISLYHVQWKSSISIPKLLTSNLKLGYLQLFGVTLATLVYGIATSSPTHWMTWVVSGVVVVDVIYEAAIFPSKTYLEHKGIPPFGK